MQRPLKRRRANTIVECTVAMIIIALLLAGCTVFFSALVRAQVSTADVSNCLSKIDDVKEDLDSFILKYDDKDKIFYVYNNSLEVRDRVTGSFVEKLPASNTDWPTGEQYGVDGVSFERDGDLCIVCTISFHYTVTSASDGDRESPGSRYDTIELRYSLLNTIAA